MGLTVLPISPRKKKQYGRWWQNTISFSTSSSKSHSDDSVLDDRCILKSSLYSNSCRTTCNRSTRQLTRARKLRHLSDKEIDIKRLSPEPSPLPLPVPDVDNLLQRDAKSGAQRSNCGSVPLPSPREVHHRPVGGEEKEKHKLESLPDALGRLVAEDGNRSVDNTDNSSVRTSQTQPNGKKRIPDDYQISFPNSAPCSPYSSPVRSPQVRPGDVSATQIMTPPSIFQVWSAPEVPSSDSTLDPGFCYQGRHDVAAHNGDESSTLGPGLSPPRSCKGSTETAPQSLIKFPVETQLPRRDNNGQANGHPLPLPPGNPMPLPPCPAAQLPAKPDLVPIQSQWQKGKLIGRGTFGSVYVASNKETGALCALKEVEILPDDPNSNECIRQLEQEIKVLSHLKHPNIVQYYGSERVGDRFYIYLEYVHPGSINKFIRDHFGAITESVVRNFTRHILCGLAYLHSTKTIHRDIKGANLLVDACGVVKLADFGMAKHLKGHAANLSLKGSPHWMAPELLQSDTYKDDWTDHALAIDIWSLGCTVIEMMNGKPPWSEYEGPAAMFKVLKETPPIPENLSVEGKDFLHCCFRRNPAERPTACMLLEHSFVKNPHPPDVISSRQPIDGMKLLDKLVKQGERLYKFDHCALSLDTECMKGKLVENLKQEPFSPLRFNHLSNKIANSLEIRPSRS